MNCDEFFKVATEGTDALDAAGKAAFEEHRARCDDCARLASGVLAYEAAIAEPGKVPAPPAWMKESILMEARKAVAGKAPAREVAPVASPLREHGARVRFTLGRALTAAALLVSAGGGFLGGFLSRSPVIIFVGPDELGSSGTDPLTDSLERFRAIVRQGGPGAIEARLGAADLLLILTRKDAARAEALPVIDDHEATADQKERATTICKEAAK